MFTGIVAEAGTIQSIQTTPKSIALTVRARSCGAGLKPGDSVAVNGCCLTVVKLSGRGGSRLIQFDLLKESWKRTNFQYAVVGGMVNLERALRADAEFGGHFVTGHVDGLGKIIRWEKSGADHVLDISAPPEVMRYLIFKGSVAVDGISLTVSAVRKKDFRIWIIPHTFNITALRERKVGDSVNLEVDMLGKYVEKFLNLRSGR
jgi:riboflavin synthase